MNLYQYITLQEFNFSRSKQQGKDFGRADYYRYDAPNKAKQDFYANRGTKSVVKQNLAYAANPEAKEHGVKSLSTAINGSTRTRDGVRNAMFYGSPEEARADRKAVKTRRQAAAEAAHEQRRIDNAKRQEEYLHRHNNGLHGPWEVNK